MDRKELVEKMIAAYHATHESHWVASEGMDAALSVAIEELLKPPSREEFHMQGHKDDWSIQCWYPDDFEQAIKDRRSKLEKVKAPSENAKAVGSKMLGVTFTPDDADYLIKQVIAATTPGYEPPWHRGEK